MSASVGSVGPLYVIGGAEDKLKRRTVLRSFVEASGGRSARIAVIPTASSLGPEIIDLYAASSNASVPPRSSVSGRSRVGPQTTRPSQPCSTTPPASS